MEECQVHLTGYVATQPEARSFPSGATRVRMRVAWTERRRDRVTGGWVDGATSYVTVYCWRKLAANVAVSLRTGDPVLVKGRLLVRVYEGNDGKRRTAVDVEASSIGHDMHRGVSKFMRVRPDTGMTAAEFEAARAAGQDAGDPLAIASGNGQAGPGDGDGDGQGLRFAGGLEQDVRDVLAAVPDLPDPAELPEWSRDADRADLEDEEPAGAVAEAQQDEPEPEAAAAAV
ncbi:MAG TPA: single-stranded DNA-binding protein [Streptosporangiaceae bacterium]